MGSDVTKKAIVMRKIAHMARGLGLEVAASDLHPGAVWCKTTGGKDGCLFIIGEDVGIWGRKWTAAAFFNAETHVTKTAFIKANHRGAAFAVWLEG